MNCTCRDFAFGAHQHLCGSDDPTCQVCNCEGEQTSQVGWPKSLTTSVSQHKPARSPKDKTDWRDELLTYAEGIMKLLQSDQVENTRPELAEEGRAWLKRYRDLVGSAG